MAYVQQCSKVDFIFVSLCFENILFLTLDFFQVPCWSCLDLFPFRVHCSCCIRDFHRLWHRNELVNHCCGSSQYILCTQCDLRVLLVEKVPLDVLWIHEIPLHNHTSSLESFEMQFPALQPLSWCQFEILFCKVLLVPSVFPIFSHV